MEDLERKYQFLRTEERSQLRLVTDYHILVAELKRGISQLEKRIVELNDLAGKNETSLQDVRELLQTKGLSPVALATTHAQEIRAKAEDNANFEFYCLGSEGAKKRAAEKENESRRYREMRDKRGYDSDFDL